MTAPPPDVAKVFKAAPPLVRARLHELRKLIFAAAKAADVGEVEETLKWGQPSYLPVTPRVGTTLRLGWSPKDPDNVALYVHCQTKLVDRFRDRFPTEFTYEGNRALHLPVAAPLNEAALQQIAAMVLTYHRDKKALG